MECDSAAVEAASEEGRRASAWRRAQMGGRAKEVGGRAVLTLAGFRGIVAGRSLVAGLLESHGKGMDLGRRKRLDLAGLRGMAAIMMEVTCLPGGL